MKIYNIVKHNIIPAVRSKGFFHLLSANLLIQVVAFASQLFVAGILSPEDIGRIKIVQTFLSVFSVVAGMGFYASTLKLCSENRSDAEQDTLFRSALIFTVVSTVSVYFIVLVLNQFRVFSSDKLIQWLIPIGLFPIISNSLFIVIVSYFQAIKKIKLLSYLTVSNKLLSIAGIVILTYVFGIKGYYWAYNLSFILMLLVCGYVLRTKLTTNGVFKINKNIFSQHWQYARPTMISCLLSELSAYIDIILIGFFIKDMHQIGFYSFALTMTVIFRIIPNTVQQITIPFFSSLAQQKPQFVKSFRQYNRLLYIVVFSTLFMALIFVPVIVGFIFDAKYDQSMYYFPLLAIGWSLKQLVQLQNGAIFGLGRIQYNVKISLYSLLFNIVFMGFSLFFWGVIGAAYASIPAGIVLVLLSGYYYRKAENEM